MQAFLIDTYVSALITSVVISERWRRIPSMQQDQAEPHEVHGMNHLQS